VANPFAWLTFGQAKAEVALRLGDEANIFWTATELGLYVIESLRVFNALTAYWATPYTFSFSQTSANWYAANGTGSPRKPTLTDTDVYTLIEYHLLEPPTGSTWTGTNQFAIADLSQACSRRRNEILQAAACNMAESSLPMTQNTSAVALTDLVLDVRRCRWVPAPNEGSPVTLQRGDSRTFQYFTPRYAQTIQNPLRWDVIGSPPQAITVDTMVNAPSVLQVLGMAGGADFAPPTSSPLLMPDDWTWVLKFGAMADILSKEQEGKDLQRAQYCRQRYMEGLKLMAHMPWLLQGLINGVPVDTQALAGADRTNYEWQSRAGAFPEIVVGGIDMYAVSPIPTDTLSLLLMIVGNAPIPANDAAEIQVPRDVMDAILSEAQHLALFKCGGAEFQQSIALHKEFVAMCLKTNARLRESGILSTTIRPPVDRQEEAQPRYAAVKGK
jgi:hypothetical protein